VFVFALAVSSQH